MKERYGLESRQFVKDAHSPAGQEFYAPPSLAHLPDCPKCRFGTPMKKKGKVVCIDCGFIVAATDDNSRKGGES